MESTKPRPVFSDELGPLQYAVWENQTQNGKRLLNIELTRAYQNENGWQREKIRLRDFQVVLLAHLLKRCLRDIDAHATDGRAKSKASSTA